MERDPQGGVLIACSGEDISCHKDMQRDLVTGRRASYELPVPSHLELDSPAPASLLMTTASWCPDCGLRRHLSPNHPAKPLKLLL